MKKNSWNTHLLPINQMSLKINSNNISKNKFLIWKLLNQVISHHKNHQT